MIFFIKETLSYTQLFSAFMCSDYTVLYISQFSKKTVVSYVHSVNVQILRLYSAVLLACPHGHFTLVLPLPLEFCQSIPCHFCQFFCPCSPICQCLCQSILPMRLLVHSANYTLPSAAKAIAIVHFANAFLLFHSA